jgi:putative ABC transport system permease protein
MLYNYWKIALRNLLKNKLFSLINILGMSLSLASVFIIGLFVMDEHSFDKHISNVDRKFRVVNTRYSDNGEQSLLPIIPYPTATYLEKDFPEIESSARMMDTYGDNLFEAGTKQFQEGNGVYAETAIGPLLSLQYIEGDPLTALDEKNRVVLTQSLAKKYFGEEKALNKPIRINKIDFAVSGVVSDPPDQFHLGVRYFISFPTLTQNWTPIRFENWINQQYFTYIELKPDVNAEAFNSKLKAFVEKYAWPKTKPEGFYYIPHLQPVSDIHLHSANHQWEIARRGNAQMVYILVIAAVLILVIASLNFINLSTARSLKRMKEVGVRKVVGAYRSQLTVQFMLESVLLTLASLAIAVTLTQLLLPALNNFTEKSIIPPFDFFTSLLLIGAAILLGCLAGSYPALHLSQFRPSMIFANKEGRSGSVDMLRKGLVIVQFAFSFFLIIGAMVVIQQNDLLRNKDLGFNKDHVIVVPLTNKQLANAEALKHEYANHPSIKKAGLSYGLPGDIVAGDGIVDAATGKPWGANMFIIDEDFLSTMDMKVIAGRSFSKSSPADSRSGFILNEEAVKSFGYGTPENAIGKKIDWTIWGKDSVKHGEVIGVVKDFHFRSLRDKIAPVVMHVAPDYFYTLTLRISGENVAETIAHLKNIWEKAESEWPFDYRFLDDNFDAMYKNEQKLSSLLTWFTGFAIFIACLGLFGLVEYNVNQRAKEISIRKVFGANIASLLFLLTRRYFVLILIAFVIVIPISIMIANQWLESFAYRIKIHPLLFAEAAALVTLITLVTVVFQSLKAANSNPAKVLKNE